VFDQFTHLVAEASLWAYVIILLFSAIDAILPIVPSETAVITAGVVAASGDLFLPIVIAAAALGAFAGDNTAYFLGRRYGARIKERFFNGEKAKRRVTWAEQQLTERGGELIAIGRFIPGGRTAVTLSAGTLRFPWRRFAGFDAIAALIWALYASLLGYFGGRAFEGSAWKGLVVAFAIALAVTGGIELTRWIMRRRRSAR
jgi:membrane protein DedA with SNARE-associated domain